MVTVRVPATTANIGPGFDTFGCAFELYNTFQIEERPSGLWFEGFADVFCNEGNLAVVGYRAVMNALHLPMPGLYVAITQNDIPICRGLGSSSSLIVAGAAAANAIHGSPLSRLDLLAICTELEGHPDNLAPALLGGLVASYVENRRPLAVRYYLHESLRFTALIPDFELSTHMARSVLPKAVPFADAVFNVSRAAVLLKSLEEGNRELIRTALVDRLHQPYRAPLIPGYEELRARALESGALAFCISGAGPTLLCLSMDEGFDEVMEPKLSALPNNWQLIRLPIDHEGVLVEESGIPSGC